MYNKILTIIGFKITWLSCVMGELYLNSWVGIIIGCIYLIFFFYGQENIKKSFIFVLSISVIGYAFDSTLSFLDLYKIEAKTNLLFLPIWFIVLWPSFSCLLINTLTFLKKKFIISSLLGGKFGPLTYYAGIRFGLTESYRYETFILISIFWSTLMYYYSRYT